MNHMFRLNQLRYKLLGLSKTELMLDMKTDEQAFSELI